MVVSTIKCPKCGKEANAEGTVKCLCDLDFCVGQRCGADKLFEYYTCSFCGDKGIPPATQAYYDRYMNRN